MRDIKKFLVCGGGMMGSAIAQILAGLEGVEVTVYDVFPVDIEAKVRNNMKLLVEKEIVTPEEGDAIVGKITFTQTLDCAGVREAQMVVECVLEDMKMKQDLFAQLEEYVADDCIFCTNTSVMSPTEISAKCAHRERLCLDNRQWELWKSHWRIDANLIMCLCCVYKQRSKLRRKQFKIFKNLII